MCGGRGGGQKKRTVCQAMAEEDKNRKEKSMECNEKKELRKTHGERQRGGGGRDEGR